MSRLQRAVIGAGFLAAAILRLAWLAAFEDNWDMGTYRQFAEFAPRGAGLYRDIVSYSGLDHFIDVPIKNYSSGMHMRLGFAIAANLALDSAQFEL